MLSVEESIECVVNDLEAWRMDEDLILTSLIEESQYFFTADQAIFV
jgi:hypothetical protein